MIIAAVILVGIGSSIFHPEASRISFASGGKRGLAQSIFQLGGTGTAIGPLSGSYSSAKHNFTSFGLPLLR
jgi:FSR family fosmidomycin resistance protein-like MFS transporter